MKKEFIVEALESQKGVIAKQVLIGVAITAGLVLVKVLCKDKEELLDEDDNVIASFADDSETGESAE